MVSGRSVNRNADSLFRIRQAVTLLVALLLFGTGGFWAIEGWTPLESFFMTVTTVATVGYGEVHPLSSVGMLFACFLIITSVGVAAYTFSVIASGIVEGELRKLRGEKRMEREIARYSGHTVICGFGRLARITVKELLGAGKQVVVIDQNPALAGDIGATGAPFIIGSAYEDETLQHANVKSAETLLSLLPTDADNVYVTLCARDLNPQIKIIARCDHEGGEKKLIRAGANQIVSPYRAAGVGLVQRLLRPNVSEFLEIASNKAAGQLALEEVVVPTTSSVIGKTLEQAALRNRTGAMVAAMITPDGKMLLNPEGTATIQGGTTLIVLGQAGSLDKLSGILYS